MPPGIDAAAAGVVGKFCARAGGAELGQAAGGAVVPCDLRGVFRGGLVHAHACLEGREAALGVAGRGKPPHSRKCNLFFSELLAANILTPRSGSGPTRSEKHAGRPPIPDLQAQAPGGAGSGGTGEWFS